MEIFPQECIVCRYIKADLIQAIHEEDDTILPGGTERVNLLKPNACRRVEILSVFLVFFRTLFVAFRLFEKIVHPNCQ